MIKEPDLLNPGLGALLEAYGVSKVAKYLNVDRSTLYRAIRNNKIQQIGGEFFTKPDRSLIEEREGILLVEFLASLWNLSFKIGALKNVQTGTVRQVTAVFRKVIGLLGAEHTITCWVFFSRFCLFWADRSSDKDRKSIENYLARIKKALVRAGVLKNSGILYVNRYDSVIKGIYGLLLFEASAIQILKALVGEKAVESLLEVLQDRKGGEEEFGNNILHPISVQGGNSGDVQMQELS